jgi:hypothetical protein
MKPMATKRKPKSKAPTIALGFIAISAIIFYSGAFIAWWAGL